MPRIHIFNTDFAARPGIFPVVIPAEGAPVAPTFINLNFITNSSGLYTSTAPTPVLPDDYWSADMVSASALMADGYVQWPLTVGSSPPETGLVGFDAASTHSGQYETVDFCLTNYSGRYHRFKNGAITDSGINAVAGDQVRIRRSGTTLYYEYSRSGGAWVNLFTDTGVSGTLYIHVLLRSPGNTISGIIASGLE
jgi:hypothetical protein